MNRNVRHIVAKTLFNADEYLEFTRKCESADLSQSKALRDLAKHWQPERNVIAPQQRKERPGRSHNLAMFPGRRGGAPMPLRV